MHMIDKLVEWLEEEFIDAMRSAELSGDEYMYSRATALEDTMEKIQELMEDD